MNQMRGLNFGLGVVLGWQQQGAAFGGRTVAEMIEGLRMIRSTAALAGYSGYGDLVERALRRLQAGQPPSSVLPEMSGLIVHFQGHAAAYAAALNLGIVLGWLQQGARENNRPRDLAIADLRNIPGVASAAGYKAYDGHVNAALGLLLQGQPVSSILLSVTALMSLFQGQDVAEPEPPEPPEPPHPEPPEIGTLEIRSLTSYVTVDEMLMLRTNVPVEQESAVIWRSSNDVVLEPTGVPGQFRGASPGSVAVSARFGEQEVAVAIYVRRDGATSVVPAPD